MLPSVSHQVQTPSRSLLLIFPSKCSSGYRSYFDITPDLKFILGKDSKISNLFHCLGSGQGFKYAPVFGELMADCITNEGEFLDEIDEFSISRFNDIYMANFWDQVSGSDNALEAETAAL